VTPREAVEAAELAGTETAYRLQFGREMYEAGQRDAEAAAALRYEGLTREADEALAALNDRRWGPGGRERFADARPGDFPGRGVQQEAEPELEAG
jgi:hypothetical protein